MRTFTKPQARRVALAAQGFADPRPKGRVDVRHLRRVVDRVGVLQLDSVNVAVRAHYMPLFSRLGPYPMEAIDDLAYRRRELFEYWGHMASLQPVEHYPLLRWRMDEEGIWRRAAKVAKDHPGYMEAVLEEVAANGPLSVSELEDGGERTGPWWGYGKGKIALEWHFASGRIAIAERRNFARYYDLPERVLPADVLAGPHPAKRDAHRELMRLAARSLGIATAADLADYYRINQREARAVIPDLIVAGELSEVRVEGWKDSAYVHSAAALPSRVAARALISPFDSLIFFRPRTERLFDFHYRIEIYVPRPKRIHGYYVMPFLLGDELVARVDLKADRAAGVLRVPGAFLEDGSDRSRVVPELAAELRSMAVWLGLGGVQVGRKGELAPELRKALG